MDHDVGNVGVAIVPRLRRRRRVQPVVTQLPLDLYSLIDEYESEEDDGITGPLGANDPRHIFKDEAWNQSYFTYDPPAH